MKRITRSLTRASLESASVEKGRQRITPAASDPRPAGRNLTLPKVSVVLTSFNYARYITDCMRSVAAQTYENWECVVVDDRSADDSPAVIRDYIDNHAPKDRFRLIEREENGGQLEAFKTGLAAVSGDFVIMLDADDVLLDDFMATHVSAHLGVQPVAFTSSNQYQIDSKGTLIAGNHLDHQSGGYYRFVNNTAFRNGFWIWATASSMMFRRSILDFIIPAKGPTFRICADYYIAHFANLVGGSLLVPTVHGCYRRHLENNFGSNPVLGAINSVGNLDKHPPHHDVRRAIVEHIFNNYEKFYPIFLVNSFHALLNRIIYLPELLELVDKYPKIFNKSKFHYVRHHIKDRLAWRRATREDKLRVINSAHYLAPAAKE